MGIAPTIGGRGSDLPASTIAPAPNVVLAAGTSAAVVRKYTITAGSTLLLGSGSRLRLL